MALIVTIIILLILAGVSISALTGSGLFKKAQLAKEKHKNAQITEENIIATYEEIISGKREEKEENSQYINSVNFDMEEGTNEIKIIINIDIKDETKLLGYHYFVKDASNKEIIKASMSTSNTITVDGLTKSTTYNIDIIAYDIYNNYTRSNTQKVTTLEAPTLIITDTYKLYLKDKHAYDWDITPDELYEVLFNGNTNEGGTYAGALLNPYFPAWIKFTVNDKIKLYAYGHMFTDGYDKSGANVIIQKYNESTNSYEDYKTVPTKTDGTRYELVELEPGKYNMLPAARYVNFDEWEYEIIK